MIEDHRLALLKMVNSLLKCFHRRKLVCKSGAVKLHWLCATVYRLYRKRNDSHFLFARGGGGALTIQLQGPSIDDLKEVSEELQKVMAGYEGLYDIEDSFERSTEELELELKPAATNLGVTAQQLASQVRQAFFGAEAQKIQRGRDDVNVMVRLIRWRKRRSLAALRTMMIRTQNGTEVPFEEVAQVVPGRALPSIQRINRNRIIRVSADADTETVDVDAIELDLYANVIPDMIANYSGMAV